MRHLHMTGEAGHPLCGTYYRETVHHSKARRTDCQTCREIYRAEVRRRRAESYRATAQRTEFDAVAKRLLAEADRLDPLGKTIRLRPVDSDSYPTTARLYWHMIDAGRGLVKLGHRPEEILARLLAALHTTHPGQLPGEPCRHEKTTRGTVYESCQCGAVRKLPAGEWHVCSTCATR